MPKVVEIPGRKTPWRVIVPPAGDAKRQVRFFKTKADAKAFASTVADRRDDSMMAFMRLSQSERVRLLQVLERAGELSELERAVEEWNRVRAPLSKLLGDAVNEFLGVKEAKRSADYVENLTIALTSFELGRERRAVSDIVAADIESWLDETKANGKQWSAQTKLTYIRRLETFWGWCNRKGYTKADPTKDYERPEDTEGPIVILSVADCQRLLETCRKTDPGLLPYVAIGLFAGLRPDEIKALKRESFKNGLIDVEAVTSKTRRRRLVEVHPTLQAWLNVDGGEIGWVNWRRRWRKLWQCCCVGELGPLQPIEHVADIMRHSFASYGYAAKGAAWTSNECGHRESVLFRRYRALVTPEAAQAFWSLLPTPLPVPSLAHSQPPAGSPAGSPSSLP